METRDSDLAWDDEMIEDVCPDCDRALRPNHPCHYCEAKAEAELEVFLRLDGDL